MSAEAVAEGAPPGDRRARRRHRRRLFFEPTVLTGVTREMRINREKRSCAVQVFRYLLLSAGSSKATTPRTANAEVSAERQVFTENLGRARSSSRKPVPAGVVSINEDAPTGKFICRSAAGSD